MLLKEILVAYDIADNKARDTLFDKLKDHGLKPIQKSVMWGLVTQAEEKAIASLLREKVTAQSDRAILTELKLSRAPRDRLFGYTERDFEVRSHVAI